VLYACELCAQPAPDGAGRNAPAQWFVELHDTAVAGSAPFFIAGLRLLAAR
jgi:hypothetical protein